MKEQTGRHDFRRASNKAIANARLRAAVRKTAGLLERMRAATVAGQPGFEELRAWGRSRKLEISGNLEKWIALFTERVEALGGVVHRARDGAEAGRIAVEIARSRGVLTAVKAKSMTAEEVGLNQTLEAAGVEVTETDLGEFIIQLAGERPSHILAPAIHRSQDEVRALFAERLGAPADLDVEGMVRFARRVLRQRFLEAGMGITGANFAVADSGTLALVSNEGNGRLCTSLPPLHLALVGIDKLIPSLADLPDFLSLLTCSATGQRLSSYLSLISGPRRGGEAEGPQELHVILLDHGRSRIAQGPWREILHCLHCGACLNHCPVYRAVGGHAYEAAYCGPMGSVLAPLLWGSEAYRDLPHACTLCGRCGEVCAVKIPLPAYHRQLRRRTAAPGIASRLAARAAARPRPYRLAVAALRRTLRSPAAAEPLLRDTAAGANWLSCRELPRPEAGPAFRQWWRQRQPRPAVPGLLVAEENRPASATATEAPPPAPPPLELYLQRARALGVEATLVAPEQLGERLGALLREEGATSALVPAAGWPQGLRPELEALLAHLGCRVLNPEAGERSDLAASRLGITGCDGFLAATGSLVLASGRGRGTLASLLPEVHLAVSYPEALHPDLQAYLAQAPEALPSRLTLITGPSRTGDIEGTMTVGVHGPRRVLHWILTDTAP